MSLPTSGLIFVSVTISATVPPPMPPAARGLEAGDRIERLVFVQGEGRRGPQDAGGLVGVLQELFFCGGKRGDLPIAGAELVPRWHGQRCAQTRVRIRPPHG